MANKVTEYKTLARSKVSESGGYFTARVNSLLGRGPTKEDKHIFTAGKVDEALEMTTVASPRLANRSTAPPPMSPALKSPQIIYTNTSPRTTFMTSPTNLNFVNSGMTAQGKYVQQPSRGMYVAA